MVKKDVVARKISRIRERLERIKKLKVRREVFLRDAFVQDVVILNLQTAIQFCIDIASHIVSDNDWGVPGTLAGLFDTLYEKKVIRRNTCITMKQMTGFRNLVVHQYETLNFAKVYDIYNVHLKDFDKFIKEISASLRL